MKDVLYIIFPQAKLLEFQREQNVKLDFNDLALLEYVDWANGSRKMLKFTDEDTNTTYVWISHKKLLEDMPFLDIKESALKKKLSKLCQIGLLEYRLFANKKSRGTRAYYALTERYEDLHETKEDDETTKGKKMTEVVEDEMTTDKKMTEKDGAGVKFYPSDKEINIDKEINSISVKETKAKKSLVEQVIDEFPIFCENSDLRKEYLDFAEMRKAKGKKYEMKTEGTVRTNIKNLLKLGGEDVELLKAIIDRSIERCWDGFFPLPDNTERPSYGSKPKNEGTKDWDNMLNALEEGRLNSAESLSNTGNVVAIPANTKDTVDILDLFKDEGEIIL